MALSITDTTYAGEAAGQFIVKALTGNETVQGGHIYVKEDIKKTFTIPRVSVDGIIQDYSAEPTPSGTITVSGKALNPQKFQLFVTFNPLDFNDHWFATQMEGGLLDERLPQTLESAIIQEYQKYFDNYMNKAIWQSRTTNTDTYKYWNGIIYNAIADSDVIDTASATTITAANVESQLQLVEDKIRDSVPDLLYDNDLKIFVSYKTANLWEQAQFAGSYKGMNNTERGILKFHGRPVVPIKGMPDNTMFAAKGSAGQESNLWLGVNSYDDATVKIGKLSNFGDMYFIRMTFQADVQIGFGSECVLYTTLS